MPAVLVRQGRRKVIEFGSDMTATGRGSFTSAY